VLTDALAGHTEEFLEQLTLATAGRYQLFGGGAGTMRVFSALTYSAVLRLSLTPRSH